MKQIKIILLFVLLAGISSTCKKYPEDNFISLRTAKERLAGNKDGSGKLWQFVSLDVNGVDSTATFLNNHRHVYYLHFLRAGALGGSSCKNEQGVFAKDINNKPYPISGGCGGTSSWGFDFANHKDLNNGDFLFWPNDSIGGYQLKPTSISWRIKKLYKNDFFFDIEEQGYNYHFKYKEK